MAALVRYLPSSPCDALSELGQLGDGAFSSIHWQRQADGQIVALVETALRQDGGTATSNRHKTFRSDSWHRFLPGAVQITTLSFRQFLTYCSTASIQGWIVIESMPRAEPTLLSHVQGDTDAWYQQFEPMNGVRMNLIRGDTHSAVCTDAGVEPSSADTITSDSQPPWARSESELSSPVSSSPSISDMYDDSDCPSSPGYLRPISFSAALRRGLLPELTRPPVQFVNIRGVRTVQRQAQPTNVAATAAWTTHMRGLDRETRQQEWRVEQERLKRGGTPHTCLPRR